MTFFKTASGSIHVGNAQSLIKDIPSNSVNLILTSPPFALTRKKEYGNESAETYVEWFLPFAQEFKRVLTDDGSIVLDLGGAYLPGHPSRTLYQYELLVVLCRELGFHLAQEFYHYNPSKLPAPAEWVTVRRIRVKDSINSVWWLAKTAYPKADNRKILKPYSESMNRLMQTGYKTAKRPSGHNISGNFQKDNQGAIPSNLLELPNTESNSQYLRSCKENDISPHPARFPQGFAEFFIKFLTDEGDLVLDPFAGSNTTGFVAQKLKRSWISFELEEKYAKGSILRFETSCDTIA